MTGYCDFLLTRVSMNEMDSIMQNSATTGFPRFIDCTGRIWPLPNEEVELHHEQDVFFIRIYSENDEQDIMDIINLVARST